MKTKILFLSQTSLSKVVLFVLVAFSTGFNVKAQECTTPDILPQEAMNYAWFGNPDYLPSFMDSVRNVEGIPSQYARIIPDIKWRIPIRFWILTTGNNPIPTNLLNDGAGLLDLPQERELQRLLDDANNAFRNTEVPSGIQFYMKGARPIVFRNTFPALSRLSK